MIVILAHHERSVRCDDHVNRVIEPRRFPGTILIARNSVASDRADGTLWGDQADAVVIAVDNVDHPVRGYDEARGVVEASL